MSDVVHYASIHRFHIGLVVLWMSSNNIDMGARVDIFGL